MSTTKKKLVRSPLKPPPTGVNGSPSEVLTLAEAAAYLRVSAADLLDLVRLLRERV